MYYINAKYNNEIETVDEFPSNKRGDRKYALSMLNEYRISDLYNYYYLSSRSTKLWRENNY